MKEEIAADKATERDETLTSGKEAENWLKETVVFIDLLIWR